MRPIRRCGVLLSVAAVFALGLVGCGGSGSSDGGAVRCAPGDDVVAVGQVGSRVVEGDRMVSLTGAGSRKVVDVTGDWVGSEPSISPDGKTLVVVRADGYYESAGPSATTLWLLDTQGKHPRPLTDGPYDASPSWSPDGRAIAFSHYDATTSRYSVRSIPSDGGRTRRVVAPQDARMDGLAWSPDGSRLAFLVDESDSSGASETVWTVRPDGAERRKVATINDISSSQLSWDPTGQALWLAGSGSGRGGLRRVGLDRGDVRLVDRHTYSADWSLDGQRLYVIRRASSDAKLTLSTARVVDGRLRIERDLSAGDDEFPYVSYGFDVGPCLPDGVPATARGLGADRPLIGTTWRDGVVALRFGPADSACDGAACPQQISTTVPYRGPVEITATVGPSTITTISSDVAPVLDGCYSAADYFSPDSRTGYRIDGDQLRLTRDGCAKLLLVAETAR